MPDDPHAPPENVASVSATRGAWDGVAIEVTDFRGVGPVTHRLRHGEATRLSVVLEEVGGLVEPRLRADQPNPLPHVPRHMHFAPAGLDMWGHTAGARFVRDATLTFELGGLEAQLGRKLSGDPMNAPRPRFADDRLWTLVRLLAEALDDPDPSIALYGGGLTTAIAARLFAPPPPTAAESAGLAPWRLRRAIDYLDARLPERVELADLAELTGLSPAHFSRGFKVSTGLAPYQWQLDARIRRAQVQLVDTDASLDHVAEATGFADAAHFGKVFRKVTGAAPAAWRRIRKA